MTYRGIGQTTFEMEPFGLIVGNPSQSPSSQCWHSGGKIAQSASVTQSPTGSVVVVVVGQATPEGYARHSSTSAGRPPRSQAGSTRCSPTGTGMRYGVPDEKHGARQPQQVGQWKPNVQVSSQA